MDLKEQDVLYVKLVRVPTFEKMCCYLGSEDDLKYIEKRLAKIHETGFQLSRQSFDEKSGRFVFAKFKNRFWRGEVIQKLEDGIYCVKLPDLGLFVKFHKSRLVNDSNPVRVRDFYPLAFCSQTYFEDSLGNDPRKLIDTKRRLNGLIENGLPALPCQIHKINHQKFLLKICLYKKTGESFQPRSTFFKLLLQHPTADLQFFKHEYNFLHPAIVLREAKKCLSNNHLSIYSSDINNNNPELYVAPRKTSPLAVVTIHNEYEMTAKHSTNSVNTVESSTTASSTSRKRDSLPLGDENAHSNIEDVDSGGDSPDNAPPEQKLPSPPPLGFVKVAQMLDLLGLKNLLDVFIDSGVTDEDAFNPENETEIGEILSGNGIMTEDVTFILHYIQNINQGENWDATKTNPVFRVSDVN